MGSYTTEWPCKSRYFFLLKFPSRCKTMLILDLEQYIHGHMVEKSVPDMLQFSFKVNSHPFPSREKTATFFVRLSFLLYKLMYWCSQLFGDKKLSFFCSQPHFVSKSHVKKQAKVQQIDAISESISNVTRSMKK